MRRSIVSVGELLLWFSIFLQREILNLNRDIEYIIKHQY